jgi:hypothetical protein
LLFHRPASGTDYDKEIASSRKGLGAGAFDQRLGDAVHTEQELEFSEVKGQQHVKREVEVAAAEGHNLLTNRMCFTLQPDRNNVSQFERFHPKNRIRPPSNKVKSCPNSA